MVFEGIFVDFFDKVALLPFQLQLAPILNSFYLYTPQEYY